MSREDDTQFLIDTYEAELETGSVATEKVAEYNPFGELTLVNNRWLQNGHDITDTYMSWIKSLPYSDRAIIRRRELETLIFIAVDAQTPDWIIERLVSIYREQS